MLDKSDEWHNLKSTSQLLDSKMLINKKYKKVKLNHKTAEKFCDLCRQAHTAWIIHKTIFEDNLNFKKIREWPGADFLNHLIPITKEYSLHQIIKLHDPADQMGRQNLTFEFIIKYGNWDIETEKKLIQIKRHLENLLPVVNKEKGLGAARNRILSHNDLKTIIRGKPLGRFVRGNDVKYFEQLKDFATIVYQRYFNESFIFDDFPELDTKQFLTTIWPRRTGE